MEVVVVMWLKGGGMDNIVLNKKRESDVENLTHTFGLKRL